MVVYGMSQPLCYCIYMTLDSGHRKLLKRPKQRDLSCNSAMSTYFASENVLPSSQQIEKRKIFMDFFPWKISKYQKNTDIAWWTWFIEDSKKFQQLHTIIMFRETKNKWHFNKHISTGIITTLLPHLWLVTKQVSKTPWLRLVN